MDNLDQYKEMTKQLEAVKKQRRSAIEQQNEQAVEKKRRAQQLREKNQRDVEEAMCGSNIAYRQMREMQAEKQRQEHLEKVMTDREKRTTEESIEAYLAVARKGAYQKKHSDNKTGASTSTSTSLAGLSTSATTPTVSLESGARGLAERRKMYAQVSISRPAAGPANARSEDRPITIPRILPARSPPTASTNLADRPSANETAMDAKKDSKHLEQTRLRQGGLPLPRAYDFESLMDGGLESEIDCFAAPAPLPSATSEPAVIATTTEPALKTYPPFFDSVVIMQHRQFSAAHRPFVDSATLHPARKTSPSSGNVVKALTTEPTDKASTSPIDAASARKEAWRVYLRLEQTRLRNGGVRGAPGSDFQSLLDGLRGEELDKVPACKISLAYKPSLDATIVTLVPSTQAKDESRRLRQAVTNDDDFEIVGHGGLYDEFDLVDGQVPSAVNGKSHSDPNAVIDGLDGAFRAGWDDDE